MAATTSLTTSIPIETQIVTLLEKLDTHSPLVRITMVSEVRTLELWRSIIAECLATFFNVFLICGAFIPWTGHFPPYVSIAIAAGFAVATLSQCFGHISGAHFNPVITLATVVTRKISPLRAFLYIIAQCGGGIAGAALLYGVTVPGYQGTLGATMVSSNLSPWQACGIELVLTFVIVYTYFAAMESQRRSLSINACLAIGIAYLACSIVALPSTGASFNPARSLGPAFVMNKWDSHWVYWTGPVLGGLLAGLIHEFIFNPNRQPKRLKDSIDGDSSSVHSDEDTYDDIDRPPKVTNAFNTLRSQHYESFRPPFANEHHQPPSMISSRDYAPSNIVVSTLYSGPARMDRAESVYGGTKSLYCRSPGPPTRANLNRSQSVYSKTPPNRGNDYGLLPKPGQLTAARSVHSNRPEGLVPVGRPDSMYIANKPMLNPMANEREGIYEITKRNNPPPVRNVTGEPLYTALPPSRREDSVDSAYGSGRTSSTTYSTFTNPPPGQHRNPVPPPHFRRNDLHSSPNSLSSGPNSPCSPQSPTSPQY